MSRTLLLRLAAVTALLLAIGHTFGAPWTPHEGAAGAGVVDAMRSIRFTALGADRSYWEFYIGFGYSISLLLFALAVSIWLVAGIAAANDRAARPWVAMLFATYAGNVWLTWHYFFAVPAVFSAVVALLLGAWQAVSFAIPRAQ